MSFADFQQIARQAGSVPASLSPALLGLWHDAQENWAAAHEAVQDDSGADAAWVHAYLHRKEGDAANAAYWYRRASKPPVASSVPLAQEWESIARALCAS